MYVTLVPSVNDAISDWFHGLDPNHGRWLVKSGSQVEKGDPVFEHHYWDFYKRGFSRLILDGLGLSNEVRVTFSAPVTGVIETGAFFSGQVRRYRDYSKPAHIHDAESLRRYSPVVTMTSRERFVGSAITFYQPWFDAIEDNLEWLETVLQKSSSYRSMVGAGHSEREWVDLINKEWDFLRSHQCPVFPKEEYNEIWRTPRG